MSYQLMFQKAVELQQNGALNEAEKIYRQILETAPHNADVLNMLGLIAQSKDLHPEAVNYFYKATEAAPKHFPIYFNLAVSLAAMGKIAESQEIYGKVLQLKPDCKEAFYALGNMAWQQNDTATAGKYFQKALDIDGQYTEAATNLAEISNDPEKLRQIADNNPHANYYLGRRAFADADYKTAISYLQKADDLLEDAEIKILLSESLLADGNKENALKGFYQAYRLNQHNATAAVNIADLESDLHNFKEAEKFYLRAIEIDEQNLQAHTNYANMLCAAKRTLEALEEYRKAILIAPKTPELSYNLALILKSMEEYEQALDLMFYAFYLSPNRQDWSLNIAETLILFYAQAPQKAQKICENWYQKMPENIVVKHLWAMINQTPSEVDSKYNQLLFDNFAPTYEKTLQDIEYNAVNKIAELHAPLYGKILDLGCGTGLAAEKLKNENNIFIGVDISQKMLEIAAQKGLYTELLQEDIVHYLQKQKPEADIIVAADVLCYFADLQPILEACKGQKIIFSIEKDDNAEKYAVQINGRYKHNQQYVANLLNSLGYTMIKVDEVILRKESGKDVCGVIFKAE